MHPKDLQLLILRCMAGRRVDSLEQRVAQQDSANRGILEQLMKVQQDFKVTNGRFDRVEFKWK